MLDFSFEKDYNKEKHKEEKTMQVLYFFESIRNPFLDFLMSALTHLGEETVLVALALLFLWCVDKREGYYLLSVSFAGLVVNQFLKIVCRVPRPWVKDPNFTIVESARAEATGYSFPSGHTQTAVGAYGSLAVWHKQKWVRIPMIALCVIVPITRMYLGVHTPADVLVSLAIGTLIVFALYPFFRRLAEQPSLFYIPAGIILFLSLAFLIFMETYTFPTDIDAYNLEHAVSNAYKIAGSMLGFILMYYLDTRFWKYETKSPLLSQVCKVLLGVIVVVLIKSLLKAPLLALTGGHEVASAIRYFLLFAVAGVCPALFPYFDRLAAKCKRSEKQ